MKIYTSFKKTLLIVLEIESSIVDASISRICNVVVCENERILRSPDFRAGGVPRNHEDT